MLSLGNCIRVDHFQKINYNWKISEIEGRILEFSSEGRGGPSPTDNDFSCLRPQHFTKGEGVGAMSFPKETNIFHWVPSAYSYGTTVKAPNIVHLSL